jgi:hypothetical protein
MHAPRGSNDRNCEKNANRQNANRLFDSQNNAAGGYACPKALYPLSKTTPMMYYFTGSELPIEWTNQHGCGLNNKSSCEIVVQYACEDTLPGLRDGEPQNENDAATATIPDNEADSKKPQYGQHETYQYYQNCKTRERNKGLYVADRQINGNNINKNDARSTRQNPGGNRRGFECPEERDYYPYFHPTPWRDVAVLTNNLELCPYYQNQSQNVLDRGFCVAAGTADPVDPHTAEHTKSNNKADCEANNGKWVVGGSFKSAAPECFKAPWNRDNHLGNGLGTLYSGTNSYLWKIPEEAKGKCVLRLRYNISTGETDFFKDSRFNGAKSFPQTDPYIDLKGDKSMLLTLNVNTNQYGRTFQDRSYVFEVKERPEAISSSARIHNLGVRGKRGNIVQTYPSVEYDFSPQMLPVAEDDYIHFQWTGSDYNPNRNPNDGEGKQNTDRHNIVEIETADHNYPAVVKADGRKDNNNRKVYEIDMEKQLMFNKSPKTVKKFAFIEQTTANCKDIVDLPDDQADNNCAKLNAADHPYFDGGPVKMVAKGTHNYMSTRNNNFSNRSQKGKIMVVSSGTLTRTWQGYTAPGEDGEEEAPSAAPGIAVFTLMGMAGVGSALGCAVLSKKYFSGNHHGFERASYLDKKGPAAPTRSLPKGPANVYV